MGGLALVTGANRGIGAEVVRQLTAQGDTVILTARDEDKAKHAASEQPGEVIARQLDVTDPGSVERLGTWVGDRFGHLDALVNNAAVHYDHWQRAGAADLEVVEDALETNLLGPWRTTLALLPALRRSAHGRIVNVSSEAGSLTNMGGGTPAYRASKAGLNALTRMLAAELAGDRILVNAICPGWVATKMGGPGGRPVSEGAASIIWAINLPDDGPTGGFYRDGLPLPW